MKIYFNLKYFITFNNRIILILLFNFEKRI